MSKYIWYAGYGSNLNRQRFLCYIAGGTPLLGKNPNDGCVDKTVPCEDRITQIPYRLYFAWPQDKPHSENWGEGGVAFLDPQQIVDGSDFAYVQIWKITAEQYEEVRDQEGRTFYDKEIDLGNLDGIPVRTITHSKILPVSKPSENYLKTIALGLKESRDFDAAAFANYMKNKEGIKGNINEEKLRKIFFSIKDL